MSAATMEVSADAVQPDQAEAVPPKTLVVDDNDRDDYEKYVPPQMRNAAGMDFESIAMRKKILSHKQPDGAWQTEVGSKPKTESEIER